MNRTFERLAIAAAVAASVLAAAPAARAEAVFRPLIADPRETLSRWRMVSYTEDWRYGTDITDSTSRGGVQEDRQGLLWEAAAGHTFRAPSLRRFLGLAPWRRYQLGVPAGIFAQFDDSGSLLNTDFQYGVSFDVQWNGPDLRTRPSEIGRPAEPDAPWGERVASADGGGEAGRRERLSQVETDGVFARPVVTSRLMLFHRSSHLGDEYIAHARFGRNQNGHPLNGALFEHPPVKRVDLTYEGVAGVVSMEWSPRLNRRRSVLRLYGGGETKLVFPADWKLGALRPRNFRSPAARFGAELRTAGNGADAHDGWLTHALRGLGRGVPVETCWMAAIDVRIAKPYNFASADNPIGENEVWTPHLWSEAPYGREFRNYAGSWHGMIGASLLPWSGGGARTPLAGPEWLIALEWYRGYAPDGQFIDQRQRWHPRWYVVPSITARF